jgi:hypothetical protein
MTWLTYILTHISVWYKCKRIQFTFELYPKLCHRIFKTLCIPVGVAGFEPGTPCSQSRYKN